MVERTRTSRRVWKTRDSGSIEGQTIAPFNEAKLANDSMNLKCMSWSQSLLRPRSKVQVRCTETNSGPSILDDNEMWSRFCDQGLRGRVLHWFVKSSSDTFRLKEYKFRMRRQNLPKLWFTSPRLHVLSYMTRNLNLQAGAILNLEIATRISWCTVVEISYTADCKTGYFVLKHCKICNIKGLRKRGPACTILESI